MKFYGLTPEPEEDRHRWFFSPADARQFIEHRAGRNSFSVLQYDSEYESPYLGKPSEHPLAKVFRPDLPVADLECGTMWWVMQRMNCDFQL